MKSFIAFFSLLLITLQGFALDVHGFEEMNRKKDGADRMQAQVARISLNLYFSGVSDTLNNQAVGSNDIYFSGRPLVCLPAKATLSPGILAAMVETEIQKPDDLVRTLGPDWKSYALTAVLLMGLARNYPCP